MTHAQQQPCKPLLAITMGSEAVNWHQGTQRDTGRLMKGDTIEESNFGRKKDLTDSFWWLRHHGRLKMGL